MPTLSLPRSVYARLSSVLHLLSLSACVLCLLVPFLSFVDFACLSVGAYLCLFLSVYLGSPSFGCLCLYSSPSICILFFLIPICACHVFLWPFLVCASVCLIICLSLGIVMTIYQQSFICLPLSVFTSNWQGGMRGDWCRKESRDTIAEVEGLP